MRRARDAIRDGLSRVWDSGGRRFVTFELVRDGRPDAHAWVQWIDGQVNLAWPREDDPADALPRLGVRLPAGASAMSHRPADRDAPGNAIVHAFDVRIDDVAEFIDRWFVRVLDAPSHYEVEARVDDWAG